ncbi:MAG: TonB-dependent receptor [Hyphomicrobiaceae bacterium]|nr:TonB-dependent receptor [Hyphomicrobiaceae bacterium]
MKRWQLLLSVSTVALVPHVAVAQTALPGIDVSTPQEAPAGTAASGGRTADDGRLTTSAKQSTSPVDPSSVLPSDLQNYSGGATRVAREQLDQERPLTIHEALVAVPGVVTVNDDGLARHGGIGIRGSNFRRSRKVLNMEDGQSINYTSYLDPSTHYTPPIDRIENIEVLRGTVFAHGPLNNHGVVNFQNLNPFGKSETVIKGALSYTEDSLQEVGNQRHVHTRQNLGNVGAVVSYTGADGSGAWDNERLRFNDLYGALGWRNDKQDLTVSGVYFWQRDDYDEDNFVGPIEAFFANGRDKTGAQDDDRTAFNTFNADYWRLQAAHNLYITDDVTLSTRVYGSDHERNRYSSREAGLADGGWMRGRVRDFEIYGVDSRIEFANLPFFGDMKQDIQAGARYEHQKHRRCTSFGLVGQVLDNKNSGNCFASEAGGFPDNAELDIFEADSFAAFIQTAVHVTPTLTVTPGLRFESYDVSLRQVFRGDPDDLPLSTGSTTIDEVLPGVAVAWEFMPRSTLYGGYHRGIGPHNVAEGDFPILADIGDNFEIGVRSTALRGFTFDVAYFHSLIDDYQIKEAFTDDIGNNVFGVLDEVQFNGVEMAVRADSRAWTGGPWNLFSVASYTYTNNEIRSGQDSVFEDFALQDVSGNDVPFTVKHVASLTAGVAYQNIWDASLTYTYRGAFFSNSLNSVALTCIDEDGNLDVGCDGGDADELVGGQVDDVWLLSARANWHVTEQFSLFAAGHNLTDELYVADLQDGAKPGQGRTLLGGFTIKFD